MAYLSLEYISKEWSNRKLIDINNDVLSIPTIYLILQPQVKYYHHLLALDQLRIYRKNKKRFELFTHKNCLFIYTPYQDVVMMLVSHNLFTKFMFISHQKFFLSFSLPLFYSNFSIRLKKMSSIFTHAHMYPPLYMVH